MKEAVKLVPVVVFLAVSVMIFARGPAMGLEGASKFAKDDGDRSKSPGRHDGDKQGDGQAA